MILFFSLPKKLEIRCLLRPAMLLLAPSGGARSQELFTRQQTTDVGSFTHCSLISAVGKQCEFINSLLALSPRRALAGWAEKTQAGDAWKFKWNSIGCFSSWLLAAVSIMRKTLSKKTLFLRSCCNALGSTLYKYMTPLSITQNNAAIYSLD